MAGVNSETGERSPKLTVDCSHSSLHTNHLPCYCPGERVCAKINHNVDYEGSAYQKKEILLHAALKHENIVDLKDILREIPPSPPGKPPNTRPMLIMVMEIMAGGETFSQTYGGLLALIIAH